MLVRLRSGDIEQHEDLLRKLIHQLITEEARLTSRSSRLPFVPVAYLIAAEQCVSCVHCERRFKQADGTRRADLRAS